MTSEIKIKEYNEPTEITFTSGDPDNKWIIKISRNGFKFNREAYPTALEDDFANAFVEIMERTFDIYFQKKGAPACAQEKEQCE